MSGRNGVQAGDEALGDGAGGAAAENLIGGLTAEETLEFEQMRQNSIPGEVLRNDGTGEVDTDADAAAAAAALAAGDGTGDAAAAAGAAPAPAPADADDDDHDPTEGGKFPQRVNYQRFKRTQEKLRNTEKELQEARERVTRFDERFKILTDAAAAGAPPAAAPGAPAKDPDELGPMPNPEEDIFAFAKWQAKKNELLERQLTEVNSGVQAQTEETKFRQSYQSDVATFAQKQPDFMQAYQFMMASRVAELAASMFGVNLYEQGAQLDQQQIAHIGKIVENEEKQLGTLALKNGRSPAQQLYTMAYARGYRPAAAAPAPAAGAAPAAAAAAPAAQPKPGAAPAAPATPSVSAAIAAVKRGVQDNKSLSSAGGAPETPLTGAALADMSDDEFDHFMQTASKDQLRAVLGH